MEDNDQSCHEEAPDDQGNSSGQTTRSYECNFCKRGFSNAQALGGHMNIHRKDKAKIKQSSSKPTKPTPPQQQLRIMDITKTTSSSPPIPSRKIQQVEFVRSTEDGSTMINIPSWVLPKEADDDRSKEYQKLQLFAETPTSTKDHDGASAGSESTSHSSNPPELDLELRLGPEPRDSSSTELGTKTFF